MPPGFLGTSLDSSGACAAGAAPDGGPVATAPADRFEAPAGAAVLRALALRAEGAGVGAVWTADYSGTVELRRLAGPHDRLIRPGQWHWGEPVGAGPWSLACPAVRVRVYQASLTTGSQFEIYRWVNLLDLARLWPRLALPAGVRAEWERALRAAGLAPGRPEN